MQFTFESWFGVISGVLKVANLIDCFCPYLSVSVLDYVPLLLFVGIYTFKQRSAAVDNYFIYFVRDVYIYRLRKNALEYVLNRN